MNKATERLWNGLVKENPTLVLMLGMCPTLAVTTSAINGAITIIPIIESARGPITITPFSNSFPSPNRLPIILSIAPKMEKKTIISETIFM